MNRSRWWMVAALAVVVVGGVWWKGRSHTRAPRYRTAAVERGSVALTVSATGTVRPVEQVDVGSQVSGTVQRIFVDYNSRVKRGQVLLQLDPSSFRAREVQAEAAVARAEAAANEARRQLRRAQELIKQGLISQAEAESAESTLAQRLADLKQALAQQQAARVDLANATIRAPIDGVVIARSIDPGQTVAASLQAPKLFEIANDLAQMQVETRIDEADIGQIHPGLEVTFTVDAFPDLTFEGTVAQVRLEPIVDQGVVTYTTVIHTNNPDLKLRPGMTANVSVLVARHDDVLKVPNAALRFHPPQEMGGQLRGGAGGKPATFTQSGGAGGAGRERAMSGAGSARAETPSAAGMGGAPEGRGEWKGRGSAGGAGGPKGEWRRGAGAGGPGRSGGPARMAGGGPGGMNGARRGPGMMRGPGGGAMKAFGDTSATAFQTDESSAGYKPGAVFVLVAGKPERTRVLTGLTDGAFTEIQSDQLKDGDLIVVGLELPPSAGQNLQPPPGMGGPQFRGPGVRVGGGGGGGGGRR